MSIIETLKRIEIFRNPFFIFSPFLLLAVIVVMVFYDPVLTGDESKYIDYAKNILNGYYSPAPPNIYLGVGPGYPLILVPFVALNIPLIVIALLNSIFYYLSIVILYKTLLKVIDLRLANITTLFWAFYYNLYENFQLIQPETFSPFLISVLLYFLIRSFNSENRKIKLNFYLAGITLGYIALTKIIFGFVLLFMFAGNGLLWLLNSSSLNYKKSFMVLLIAFIITTPYLFYTYHLTGRVFYWGSVGGDGLYWMSTPYEKEYGSWFTDPHTSNDSLKELISSNIFRQKEHHRILMDDQNIPGAVDYIMFNHQKDFEEIHKFSGVARDDAMKRIAYSNIKSNPIKFIENCFCNLGRMVFNFPYTYKLQKPGTLLRFPHNGLILVFLLLCSSQTILNWRKIIFPIRFSICIFFLYIGGSVLGSAETRMFTVIVPILLLWISFVLQRTMKINWRFQ